MSMNEKCIDPDVGRLLFRWAMLYGSKQARPQDSILNEHLERCAACRNSVRHWTKQSEAAELLSEARRVVSGNLTPKDRVDEKKKENGERFLFNSSEENPLRGVLIRIAVDGSITDVSVADRASFDRS